MRNKIQTYLLNLRFSHRAIVDEVLGEFYTEGQLENVRRF